MSNDMIVRNMDDVKTAASAMAKSGYFTDALEASKAAVKILAGHEMGFGPFAAMSGIHIIKGKPAPGANLMAAAIKRNANYNFKVSILNDEVCEIEFFELFNGKWTTAGISKFTIADAKRAGTQNTQKYPRNMLYARAMSNGTKWYCPDVFGGAPTYTPEELGEEEVIVGEIIEPTLEENIVDLGFEEPELKEVELPAWVYDIYTTKENKPYVDLTDEELKGRQIGIGKALAKEGLADGAKQQYQQKAEAIALILEARSK